MHEVGPSGGPPTSEPTQRSAPPTTSQEEFPLPLQVEAIVGVQQGKKKKKKGTVIDETLRATTNALMYMDELRFKESQPLCM